MAFFVIVVANRSKTIKLRCYLMLNKEREQEILNILKTTNGFVTVKQLCQTLFASESSIRRDLKVLEKRGLVKRSYGGAALENNHSSIVTFNHRTRQNVSAKREMAKKAAGLIQDGQIVFLDQSSTAFYLAGELINRNSLTVVTNNTQIMMLLSNSKIKLICSGGYLSNENRNCLIGSDAQRTFEGIYADVVFFSVKAVSADGTVTDCDAEEVAVRRVMLQNANKKVLLCDSSKFDRKAAYKQCSLDDVDLLISEEDRAWHFSDCCYKVEFL